MAGRRAVPLPLFCIYPAFLTRHLRRFATIPGEKCGLRLFTFRGALSPFKELVVEERYRDKRKRR